VDNRGIMILIRGNTLFLSRIIGHIW